jgi:NUMOD4 motif/HNH endonuclease
MPLLLEHWKPVVDWEEKYEVSNLGAVRRIGSSRRLKRDFDRGGYPRISLGPANHRKHKFVHVMVAEVFIGPRLAGWVIDHLDSIRTNARASNLEYVTPMENVKRAVLRGNYEIGEDRYCAKLTRQNVVEIKLTAGRISSRQWAERLGVHEGTVSGIRRGRRWKHVII